VIASPCLEYTGMFGYEKDPSVLEPIETSSLTNTGRLTYVQVCDNIRISEPYITYLELRFDNEYKYVKTSPRYNGNNCNVLSVPAGREVIGWTPWTGRVDRISAFILHFNDGSFWDSVAADKPNISGAKIKVNEFPRENFQGPLVGVQLEINDKTFSTLGFIFDKCYCSRSSIETTTPSLTAMSTPLYSYIFQVAPSTYTHQLAGIWPNPDPCIIAFRVDDDGSFLLQDAPPFDVLLNYSDFDLQLYPTDAADVGVHTVTFTAHYRDYDFPLMEHKKPFQVTIEEACNIVLLSTDDTVAVPSDLAYVNFDPALIIPFAFKLEPACNLIHSYSIAIDNVLISTLPSWLTLNESVTPP